MFLQFNEQALRKWLSRPEVRDRAMMLYEGYKKWADGDAIKLEKSPGPIYKANNEAFKEVALRWRDPGTGETEPDLRKAVVKMVCDFFSVLGWGCCGDNLYQLISDLQDAALRGDARDPVELIEGEIASELRASLKQLYTDPDPGCWCLDDGQWDWELSLRDAQEDIDCGYVAIIPLKDEHRFKYKIKPDFSHREWAIKFVVGFDCPAILVKGSLQEAKRRLDMLIGFTTPEITD